jgi:hypothetical protein
MEESASDGSCCQRHVCTLCGPRRRCVARHPLPALLLVLLSLVVSGWNGLGSSVFAGLTAVTKRHNEM